MDANLIIYQIKKIITIEQDKEKNVHIILHPDKLNGTYECVMTQSEFRGLLVKSCMHMLKEEGIT